MSSENGRVPGVELQNRRDLLKTIGGAGMASLVAGCTGGQDESSPESSPTQDGDGGTTTETTETEADASEIQKGGTLRFVTSDDLFTLNPFKTIGLGIWISEQMGNHLVRAMPDQSIVPNLAKDWQVSDDGMTYTFQIREGVQFHPPYDREAKAEDVVWTWRKILEPDYGAYGYGYFQGILTGEGIDTTETVQETGEYEITFNLANPYADFLIKQALNSAFGWFPVIPRESFEEHGEDFGTPEVGWWGTGPFMYNAEESQSGVKYVIDRNPNYFMEDEAGNQLPYLDRVEFSIAPEASVRKTQLLAGDVDLDPQPAPKDISTFKQENETKVMEMTGTANRRFWWNIHKFDPLTVKSVRKAMMHGMNRNSLVETIFQGHATVAHGFIPPFHWAYSDEALTKYEHDPNQAQQLLSEGGYQDGFSITLNPHNSTIFKDAATVIQQNLSNIGLDVSVEPMESGANFNQFRAEIPDSSWHASLGGFTWTFAADDFTRTEFHSEGSWNWSHYSNERVDEVTDKARKTLDREKRKEFYAEFQEIVSDEVPMAPVWWANQVYAMRERVQNLPPYSHSWLNLQSTWLKQ